MNCEMSQTFLDGYFDGELDLVRSVEMEQHLQSCPICAEQYRRREGLRAVIQASRLSEPAPGHLHQRLQQSLKQSEREAHSPLAAFDTRRVLRWGLAACLCLVALLAVRWTLLPMRQNPLTEAVIGSHIRSLMASHLVDVASTSQHTVKPWFNGRLDFAPPVVDLAASGFPLAGGRLDYLDGRPVAALVYRRRKHWINLFIWPSSSDEGMGSGMDAAGETRRGYVVRHWTQSGMTYWAVSDLNAAELTQFTSLFQASAGVHPTK